MPKDDFDMDDPLELNGAIVASREDNDEEMATAFIEEFMMIDFTSEQILALFKNPHYIGPHRVYRNKGEAYVTDLINKIFGDWI